jgi:hypothetical protein
LQPRQCLVSTVAIGALSGSSQTSAEYPHALHLYFELLLMIAPNLLENSSYVRFSKRKATGTEVPKALGEPKEKL